MPISRPWTCELLAATTTDSWPARTSSRSRDARICSAPPTADSPTVARAKAILKIRIGGYSFDVKVRGSVCCVEASTKLLEPTRGEVPATQNSKGSLRPLFVSATACSGLGPPRCKEYWNSGVPGQVKRGRPGLFGDGFEGVGGSSRLQRQEFRRPMAPTLGVQDRNVCEFLLRVNRTQHEPTAAHVAAANEF